MSKPGRHVVLDAYVERTDVFNVKTLTDLFYGLAKTLDMDLLGVPHFEEVVLDPSKLTGNKFQDEGGITGTCVISTSHIAIHTWKLRQFFSMDIFSCKDFNEEHALKFVCDHLGVKAGKITMIERIAPDAYTPNLLDSIQHNVVYYDVLTYFGTAVDILPF